EVTHMDQCRNCNFLGRCAHGFIVACTALMLLMISSLTLADTSAVKFGIQPWPGVTVKTEVATDILEVLGYETEKLQLNTPFILHGIVSGQVDVALGGWYPISAAMITPLVEEGKLIRLTANLPHALSGMAVPVYVHEAGVDSVEDLSRYADRF